MAIIFVAPILIVLTSLTGSYSDNWYHLIDYVLVDYVFTSLLLVSGVSVLVFLIGTSTAWIVTNYNFAGKKVFEWALILPLAIPPYILAYTFTGLFDPYGDANNLLRDIFNLERSFVFFPSVRNVSGAVIVFEFTLYPYVYLVTRSAFLNQSKSLKESGRLLGLSPSGVFFKIELPLVRPALVGGLMLVIMETLSDFGAVDHFAIQTFTTGIFRTWYGLYDLDTAMQLSSILLLVIGVFYFIERGTRKTSSYTTDNSTFKITNEVKLKGLEEKAAFLLCFIPLFVGFILPIFELLIWAMETNVDVFNKTFLSSSLNTMVLAISSGLICATLALVINFSVRFNASNILARLSSFLSIGYAIPGLVLAVGIVKLLAYLDKRFFSDYEFAITGS